MERQARENRIKPVSRFGPRLPTIPIGFHISPPGFANYSINTLNATNAESPLQQTTQKCPGPGQHPDSTAPLRYSYFAPLDPTDVQVPFPGYLSFCRDHTYRPRIPVAPFQFEVPRPLCNAPVPVTMTSTNHPREPLLSRQCPNEKQIANQRSKSPVSEVTTRSTNNQTKRGSRFQYSNFIPTQFEVKKPKKSKESSASDGNNNDSAPVVNPTMSGKDSMTYSVWKALRRKTKIELGLMSEESLEPSAPAKVLKPKPTTDKLETKELNANKSELLDNPDPSKLHDASEKKKSPKKVPTTTPSVDKESASKTKIKRSKTVNSLLESAEFGESMKLITDAFHSFNGSKMTDKRFKSYLKLVEANPELLDQENLTPPTNPIVLDVLKLFNTNIDITKVVDSLAASPVEGQETKNDTNGNSSNTSKVIKPSKAKARTHRVLSKYVELQTERVDKTEIASIPPSQQQSDLENGHELITLKDEPVEMITEYIIKEEPDCA